MPGTILLGIDVETASEHAEGYVRYGRKLYHELNIPVTWYVTGATLQKYPQQFSEIEDDPLVELQSHTFGHTLLKTVFMDLPAGISAHGKSDWYLKAGGSLDQIEEDLKQCERVFLQVLGRKPIGLTGPWGYYRGLQDRPDILEVIHTHGYRYLRTFARDARDCQPVPLDWQPFWYEAQGFADILELCVHDYQDDFYWKAFARPRPNQTYAEHLKQVADRVAKEDLIWSAASHDHGCATQEGFWQKGAWIEDFVRYAKGLGIRFLSGSMVYEEQLRQLAANT